MIEGAPMLRNVRPTSAFLTHFISLLLCYGLVLSQLSFAAPLAAARSRESVKGNASAPKLGASWLSALVGYVTNTNVTTSLLPQQQSSSTVVISQLYGGGGNSGSTYKNDFIELFNRSNAIVDLTNWSVQYAPASSSTWQVTTLSGSLGPGQYLLIQETQGTGGTTNLPIPDIAGNISMNATAGKVALVNNSTPLTYNHPQGNPSIADFAGYGNSTSSYEGSGPTPSPGNTNAVLRANNGCTDTDYNSTDFDAGLPNPRNSSSPVSACGGGLPPSSTVVISEFRTRGVSGGYDEFVELYNMTDSSIDISGWKIDASNGAGGVATRIVVNPGTTLPAHGNFLATNNIASGGYSGTVAGDQTYTAGIPDDGGIAVLKPDNAIVDRVGMSNGSAFKESRALNPLTDNLNQSYERKPGGATGSSLDTNDNPSDFQVRTTSDPQNLYSPPTSSNNQPPVANAGGPYAEITGNAIQFNGSASHDPDGSVTNYVWNFGDGATETGQAPVHSYSTAGTYTITLTVTDNTGAQASASTVATVSDPPVPTPTPTPTPTPAPEDNAGANGRLEPRNRIGAPGEDLFSGNFNWSLPLMGLKGRAGLDLGLTLAYNSLTWTKDQVGQKIIFNEDQGYPAPGFRLGFPVIQGYYDENIFWVDGQPPQHSYTMIMPSGERVELRQVGTSNIYQSADSSNLRLVRTSSSKLYLTATNGMQYKFVLYGASYKCVEIKDRNGNNIFASYDSQGRVLTITDTLARVLTFNYEGNNLISITQPWGGQLHFWAQFEYEPLTIQSNYIKSDGMPLEAVGNGQAINTLKRVILADQSSYRFAYNPWGQVYKIAHHAADDHLLSYSSYNLPVNSSAPLTDCPRFTQRRDWAQYWNNDQDGLPATNEEALTTYTFALGGEMGSVTLPDNATTHKEYFGTSAWRTGLTTKVETYHGGALKRGMTTSWTQDDESLQYQQNPRPVETNVYDPQGNLSRTRVEYYPAASFSLPKETLEYDSDGTTVLRRTQVTYNLANEYVSRHIIGLVSEQTVYGRVDGQEKLASKVTYEYDTGSSHLVSQGDPSQHDGNYGAGFMHRANLTVTRRWDTESPADASKSVKVEMGYNTAGSLVFSRDPLGSSTRQTIISYTDSDGGNTLAYPTKITDAEGYFSTLAYDYFTGRVTETTDPKGAKVVNQYDSKGRLEKRIVRDGSTDVTYTGFTYKDSLTEVETRTLLDRVDNVDQLSYSSQRFDGVGRLIGLAGNHPGSQTGYNGQKITYDVLGRQTGQSNPAEINNPVGVAVAGWQLAGEDAGDWRWSTQQYDWKGRPTLTTNTDGTLTEAVYEGCGCAGGETAIFKGEQIAEGRHQQKVYKDARGRAWKTEVLNWNSTVYSTTVQSFNERDQIASVKQYQGQATVDGSCPTNTCQETTLAYDGHGRLKNRHTPAQRDQNNQPLFTTYTYLPDDMVETVTDARGAQATMTYNKRRLVTGISYQVPSGVEATPDVTFEYDGAGNRTLMTDGEGSTAYNYDTLSRLTSETRQIHIGDVNRSYALTYGYTLKGQLKSVTDPFNVRVDYNHDSAGRLASITGTPYMTGGINGTPQVEISQYATDMKYRAWGGLKSLTYGNQMKLSLDYNERLQIKLFKLYDITPPSYAPADYPTTAMSSEFQYYADGSLRYADNKLNNIGDERFDRAYQYDHKGRLQEAYSGSQARDYINGTNSGAETNSSPYRQSYQYDVWNNQTGRDNRFWSMQDTSSATYTNNRRQDPQWEYDVEGNLKRDDSLQMTWDAAGRNRSVTSLETGSVKTQFVDGDGRVVARTETENGVTGAPSRYIHSSVIGKIITQLDAQGEKFEGYVYAGGQLIAKQSPNWIAWQHENPVTGSRGESQRDGLFSVNTQPDPTGVNVGFFDPYIQLITPSPGDRAFEIPSLFSWGDIPDGRCTLDGLPFDCEEAAHRLETGSAIIDPANPPSTFGSPSIGAGTGVWVPDNSQETGSADLDNLTVTINAGNGGQFIWVPTGNLGTQITERPLIDPVSTEPGQQRHPLQTDIDGARSRVDNDEYCRDALNKLLQMTTPDTNASMTFIDNIKFVGGQAVSVDIGDAFDRLMRTNVVRGGSGVSREGSVEYINDLTVDLGGPNLYVRGSYATRTREEKTFAMLHEALHMFSGYTDQALAVAAQRVSGTKDKDIKVFAADAKGQREASMRLNDYINKNCKGLTVGSGTSYRLGD
jgi:YD repeat-containing protein